MAVGWVGAIDVYWSVRAGDILLATELNPVGRWLIRQGDVSLFMGLKVAGLTAALGVLAVLPRWRQDLAYLVMGGIFLLNLGLLCVLYG